MTRLPLHANGRPDRRYRLARVWCGYATPRWACYFCGEWLGAAVLRRDAIALAHAHRRAFLISLGLT